MTSDFINLLTTGVFIFVVGWAVLIITGLVLANMWLVSIGLIWLLILVGFILLYEQGYLSR